MSPLRFTTLPLIAFALALGGCISTQDMASDRQRLLQHWSIPEAEAGSSYVVQFADQMPSMGLVHFIVGDLVLTKDGFLFSDKIRDNRETVNVSYKFSEFRSMRYIRGPMTGQIQLQKGSSVVVLEVCERNIGPKGADKLYSEIKDKVAGATQP